MPPWVPPLGPFSRSHKNPEAPGSVPELGLPGSWPPPGPQKRKKKRQTRKYSSGGKGPALGRGTGEPPDPPEKNSLKPTPRGGLGPFAVLGALEKRDNLGNRELISNLGDLDLRAAQRSGTRAKLVADFFGDEHD